MTFPNPDFWKHIHGHFDFEDVYEVFAETAEPGDMLVEVGSLLGKSACYLGTILPSGTRLWCVDEWPLDYVSEGGVCIENPYGIFMANVAQCGVSDKLTPLQKSSLDAAKEFAEASLHAVFIDASHDYKDVKADIEAWRPKVGRFGYIGGHDYGSTYPGVKRAVDEIFSEIEVLGQSWLVQIER